MSARTTGRTAIGFEGVATCDKGLPAMMMALAGRLWAALQAVGGGTWGGCVYDVDAIQVPLERGRRPA